MKKMYLLTIALILLIASGFLFFSRDTDAANAQFLSSYGIVINSKPISFEEIAIPAEFDEMYSQYNMMQIECGLDLYPVRGKNAVRYTYEIMNMPDGDGKTVYANVICVRGKPVAGDVTCPSLDGFTKPLNFLSELQD